MAGTLPSLRTDDIVSVRSRVNWGAILAGAMVTFTVSLVLGLFAAGLGLSMGDGTNPENLKTGTLISLIVIGAIAFFAGGITSTHCTVGENSTEAVLHGVVTAGAAFVVLFAMTAAGVQASFSSISDIVTVGHLVSHHTKLANGERAGDSIQLSRQASEKWLQGLTAMQARAEEASSSPSQQQAIVETASHTAWWAFIAVLVSVGTSIAGALSGAGRTFHLRRIRTLIRRVPPRVQVARP